ncbi:MAG: hypothetical protein ACOX2L_10855 [Anaerolineae bacterium]|jgi:hypothetical protein|nr:hypothetical protein [Chloroflexota bacterium]
MTQPELPARYRAFHSAGGALLYSALGAAWALLGVLEMRPVGMPEVAVALGLATGLLLILSVRGMQRANAVEEEAASPEASRERGLRGARTHWVFRVQAMLITAASAALVLTNRHAYVAPVTALIVGLHFVAMSSIHRTPGEGLMGAAIALAALATVLWVPGIPSIHRNPMNLAAGFGTALILWAGAAATLLQQRQASEPELPPQR